MIDFQLGRFFDSVKDRNKKLYSEHLIRQDYNDSPVKNRLPKTSFEILLLVVVFVYYV